MFLRYRMNHLLVCKRWLLERAHIRTRHCCKCRACTADRRCTVDRWRIHTPPQHRPTCRRWRFRRPAPLRTRLARYTHQHRYRLLRVRTQQHWRRAHTPNRAAPARLQDTQSTNRRTARSHRTRRAPRGTPRPPSEQRWPDKSALYRRSALQRRTCRHSDDRACRWRQACRLGTLAKSHCTAPQRRMRRLL